MNVLLDVSSYAWRCLLAGQDKENGYTDADPETGKERWINSAQYGWDNLSGCLKKTFDTIGCAPKDVILVLDGVGGKQLRSQYYSAYKAGRSKSPAMYKQYNRLEQILCEQMLQLGAQVVTHKGVEADDIIAYFCETLTEERVVVLSHDKDMLALAKHPHVAVYIQEQINPPLFGLCPFEFADVYKATVGDTSDNIPGARGFGPAAFDKLYTAFGDNGLAVLRKLIQTKRLKDLEEDVAKLPTLQKLIDYAPDVEMSLKLATLYPNQVQPETLQWQHGMCRTDAKVHPHLSAYAQRVTPVSSHNFYQVFEDIKRLSETSHVVLDIETHTPDISDDWLYEIRQEQSRQVDVFGSELTGVALTLGNNFQHTFYFAVNHAQTDNIGLPEIDAVLKFLNTRHRFIIHNVNFELVVLHNELGWFLRDVDDTKLMASYVDENGSLGLKQNSLRWLGYEQESYEQTTKGRKMNALSLEEVLNYGADDTICTAALYNWFRIQMMLEQVWNVYRNVEIGAAFWTAQAFLDGADIDQTALRDMIARDDAARLQEMKVLDQYLIAQGWQGTRFQAATQDNYLTPAWVKYAFELVSGAELKTAVRKPERLIEAVREHGQPELARALESGDVALLNRYVRTKFSGSPSFNTGSPKQMQTLLYEVMNLPVRLRNKPTDRMRALGQEGTPQTDDLAVQTALHYDLPDENDPRRAVLAALTNIKTYNTRFGLYYKTYPKLPHWKDGKIHASLNQCSTATRRYSSSNPNLQQLSKGAGDFRRIFVPHHKNAMIVSLDFSAQELRIIADYSQDPNMLACYIGAELRDLHSLTAAEIAKMDYHAFKAVLDDETHEQHKWAKDVRKLAKTVNFSSEYGAQAPKMAQNLMCSEEEAQRYLDAKEAAFPRAAQWKQQVMSQARKSGYATTMLGARRHLNDLHSSDKWAAAKAERQAVNFKIQGSGAEMTKLAAGRMWYSGLRTRYDIRFIGLIHDEVVFSIAIKDIPAAVPEIHRAMTAPYAGMVVPVESSVSLGENFMAQHELNAEPTAENLQQMLAKIRP